MVLNITFLKYKKVPLCQGSEYIFPKKQVKFRYVMVLNISSLMKNKKVPLFQGSEYTFPGI